MYEYSCDFWCRIYLWFRWLGVCMQSRWRHSVTESHTRWRICVTIATLWQQQDGGCMLFYIFNSTVVDWTCFFLYGCETWSATLTMGHRLRAFENSLRELSGLKREDVSFTICTAHQWEWDGRGMWHVWVREKFVCVFMAKPEGEKTPFGRHWHRWGFNVYRP